jgi:hypothetical protein
MARNGPGIFHSEYVIVIDDDSPFNMLLKSYTYSYSLGMGHALLKRMIKTVLSGAGKIHTIFSLHSFLWGYMKHNAHLNNIHVIEKSYQNIEKCISRSQATL